MPKTSRNAPYLGKIQLRWCLLDNIPIISRKKCPNCGELTKEVRITPPGDVRPAFDKELERIRKIVDIDYGIGLGNILFPHSKIYLINKVPSLDHSQEIISDGEIQGVYIYDPIKQKFNFKPRIAAGKKIVLLAKNKKIKLKKTITISDDSLPYILDGKSILAPGVIKFSEDIKKGDNCLILNKGNYVTTGISFEDSPKIEEMIKNNYGKVCKNLKKNIDKSFGTKKGDYRNLRRNIKFISWDFVFSVNSEYMEDLVKEAKTFIKNTSENQGANKPIAVAYSGGKDSLAVLLLTYESLGPNFKIFFADTGLEFSEIIQNTKKVAEILKMTDNLIIRSAKEKFWDLVEDFGPPARDYRFCCHTLKAQQITDIISEIAGNGKVLSFLGQRRYESFSRSTEKRIYINSFIPQQIAATPIREWNALEVWLYILYYPHKIDGIETKIPITSLYFEGFNRIGCYLCPATSLSLFELMREIRPELIEKWDNWLDSYSKKYGYPEEWIKYGLWRFKKVNNQWKNMLQKIGVNYDLSLLNTNTPIDIAITKGFSPCAQYGGYSLKGKVNIALDLNLIQSISPIIKGTTENFPDLGVLTINHDDYKINIFTDGSFYIRVTDKTYNFSSLLKNIIGIIVKSQRCNGCGVCEKICPEKIIKIKEDPEKDVKRPYISSKLALKCNHCGKCITHCPNYQKIKEKIQ